MESTQGLRWDVVLASSVAIATTAGMFVGLAVMMRPAIVPIPPSRTGMEVVWIAPPSAPLPAPRAQMHARPRDSARTASRAQPRIPVPTPSNAVHDAAPPADPGRPLSAVYLGQMCTTAEPAVPAADPLADRRARLPGEGGGRFRMREPTTVASVVNGIGRMFGGRDPDEPCRENRRNIGELALDGDSAALQQQLDYEHRLCRP